MNTWKANWTWRREIVCVWTLLAGSSINVNDWHDHMPTSVQVDHYLQVSMWPDTTVRNEQQQVHYWHRSPSSKFIFQQNPSSSILPRYWVRPCHASQSHSSQLKSNLTTELNLTQLKWTINMIKKLLITLPPLSTNLTNASSVRSPL